MELTRIDPDSGGVSRLQIKGPEEVFLGRNPTTEITDTLVSRKHASIRFDDISQKWKLNANKVSFHKMSETNEWLEVHPGAVTLSDGDTVSLLKDKYIYRCRVVGAIEVEAAATSTTATASSTTATTPSTTATAASTTATNGVESEMPKNSSPVKNERVLPAWMMEDDRDEDEDAVSSPKKDSRTPSKQARKKAALSESPKKSPEEKAGTISGVRHEISDSDEEENVEEPEVTKTLRVDSISNDDRPDDLEVPEDKVETVIAGSNLEAENGGQVAATEAAGPSRLSCAYGSACYRKNPQHRLDEAHPGDPDYKDGNEDGSPDDSRPECQYGLMCYRQNPQHKKDFKHTQNPGKGNNGKRPKRAAKKSPKKKKRDDDEDGDDADDYESSFIDDESEEDLTPDESDEEEWLPEPNDSD